MPATLTLALSNGRVLNEQMSEAEHLLDDRKRRILFALMREYVRTALPVGSAALVREYGLDMSPATVRNELGALEELGYLMQPHVSAGRVPTERTYRLFVDSLGEELPEHGLTLAERRAVSDGYAALRREVDGLMRETSAVLTRLTDTVAVVLAPTLGHSRLKHVDLVSMAEHRIMVVLITDTGRVVSTVFEMGSALTEKEVAALEGHINRHLVGLDLDGVRRERLRLYALPERQAEVLGAVVETIIRTLTEEEQDRVFLGGTSNLLRQPEFGDPCVAMPVLELVEKSAELLRLMGRAIDLHHVTVWIGQEMHLPQASNISVVATGYGVGEEAYGSLGLLGPVRMDYERAVSAVRCVADNLSESLRALHS